MKTFLYALISYMFWQEVAIISNLHSDGFWVQDGRFDFIMFLGFLIIWFVINTMNNTEYKEPITKNDSAVDCVDRQTVINELKRYFHDEYYQRTSIQDCRDCFIEDVLNHLPSVTPQAPKWIPVSKKMPEEAYACLVTVLDINVKTQEEFENILPYFVGYDGETWNNIDGEPIPFEVIAWMPVPLSKAYSEEEK